MTQSMQLVDRFLKDMNELDDVKSAENALKQTGTNETVNIMKTKPIAPIIKNNRIQMGITTRVLAKKKKSPSWLRRKEELNALRQQTQAMETRVAFLQIQKEKNRRKLSPSSMKQLQTWKVIAATEQQQLKEAQDNNDVLKSQVRAYSQLLGALQAAVSANCLQDHFTIPSSTLHVAMEERRRLHVGSASTFNTLETIVDERLQDIQTILDQFHQTSPVVDHVEVHMNRGGDGTSTAMEYKVTQVLPFHDVAALNAVWNVVGACSIPQKQHSQIVRQSADTYVLWSCLELQVDQVILLGAHSHSVVKRRTVPDGTVMVAESITKWSAYRGDSKLWSHKSRDSMWFTIRKFPLDVFSEGRTPQQFGCQLNARVRSEAAADDEAPDKSEGLPSTHIIVMPLYREMLDAQRQFLENRMWDSMRA